MFTIQYIIISRVTAGSLRGSALSRFRWSSPRCRCRNRAGCPFRTISPMTLISNSLISRPRTASSRNPHPYPQLPFLARLRAGLAGNQRNRLCSGLLWVAWELLSQQCGQVLGWGAAPACRTACENEPWLLGMRSVHNIIALDIGGANFNLAPAIW